MPRVFKACVSVHVQGGECLPAVPQGSSAFPERQCLAMELGWGGGGWKMQLSWSWVGRGSPSAQDSPEVVMVARSPLVLWARSQCL